MPRILICLLLLIAAAACSDAPLGSATDARDTSADRADEVSLLDGTDDGAPSDGSEVGDDVLDDVGSDTGLDPDLLGLRDHGAPEITTDITTDPNVDADALEPDAPVCSPVPEVCDGFDDDCDGFADNGCAPCGSLHWATPLPGERGEAAVAALAGGGSLLVTGAEANVLGGDGTIVSTAALPFSSIAAFGLRTTADQRALGLGLAGESNDEATLTRFARDGSMAWRLPLGLGGATSGALLVVDHTASAALSVPAVGARPAVWLLGGALPRSGGAPEPGSWRVVPGGGPVAEGAVAGLAGDAGAQFLALNDPPRVLRLALDGRPGWVAAPDIPDLHLSHIAVNGDRLAVFGSIGGEDDALWVATLNRRTGAIAWERRLRWGVSHASRGLGVDAEGQVLIVADSVEDGDARTRAMRLEPGTERSSWSTALRYAQTTAAALGPDGALHWIGTYDGPTGRQTWVRRLFPPCAGGRESGETLVFVLSGQSNMVGVGPLADVDPSYSLPFPEVDLYWEQTGAIAPLSAASAAGFFGPELSFGRDVADAFPNQPILLVKYAVGGTNLHTQWHPGESAEDPARGPLYQVWQGTMAAALEALEATGAPTRLAGMAWMQGESDGVNLTTALAYEANLTRFIRRTRDDLGLAETIPFAIGRIFAPTIVEREHIRVAEEAVAAEVFDVSWVDTDDLGLIDVIHYDGPGQLALGHRLAAGVIQAPRPTVRVEGPRAALATLVPESSEFAPLLAFDVPRAAVWAAPGDVPYTLDRRDILRDVLFDRVAYFVELRARDRAPRWVWVSMAAFSDDVDALAVPTDAVFDTAITDLNVRSNLAGLGPLDGVGGTLEFWSDCYATGEDGRYDHDDVPSTTDCYGSMQVHAAVGAPESVDYVTVFALNRWANGASGLDLGIGSWGGLHPDWTFSQGADGWETRRVQVFVR